VGGLKGADNNRVDSRWRRRMGADIVLKLFMTRWEEMTERGEVQVG
jgi:hypothetical protein